MVTPLPSKPTDYQDPWFSTIDAWMNGVALNIAELNTQDTTHAALNSHLPIGGTTGQVLAKTSGSNYAVGWVTGGGTGNVTPPVTLTGTDINTVPLTVVGPASQATHYFNVQNSSLTPLFQIQVDGEVAMGPAAPSLNGTLKVGNTDPARRGIVFKAASAQSGRLLDLLDSTGSTLMGVNADGTISSPSIGAKVIVLNAGAAVPSGTPAGTVILRRP